LETCGWNDWLAEIYNITLRVVLLHKPDKPDKPDKPPPKCHFLIKLDRMHSLIAHFQDLSKDDTLVMVCVLVLTKTQTTLNKKMFF
jgi:hypothetical protein